MRKVSNLKGFTLIEILIVIGLIAILAAVTIIALNPTQNFEDATNSTRRAEIAGLWGAINRWQIDGGDLTTLVSNSGATVIPDCAANPPTTVTGAPHITSGTTPAALLNYNFSFLVSGGYMGEIPTTGETLTNTQTGYYICETATAGVYTIFSNQDGGGVITVTR
jgi:type IV pilus assembly protein PilA